VYSEGFDKIGGYDLTEYVKFDTESNTYDFSGLHELIDRGNLSPEQEKTILEWEADLKEQTDIIKDGQEAQR
jgi:hypothetical protein